MVFKQTASGAAWLVAARLMSRTLDLLALLMLARFLTPADFGVVAVAMTLILVVEAVLELPVGQVLIRLPLLEAVDLDTAFSLALLRAFSLSAIVALLAWPFSLFYGDPRLFGLLCVLSLAPAARGLVSPRMVVFAKRLDFRPDFLVEVSGKLTALTLTVTVALSTSSYWAIVAGTLATPLTMMFVSYVVAPYRPRFSLERWREFAGFLGWMSAAQAVNAVNWQCDRLLLGRFITHSELGQFSMASDLSFIPLQVLVVPTMRSVMPAFVGLGSDLDRIHAAYQKAVAGILTITLPALICLSVLAEPGIRLVLGYKWLPAAPLLQWIALSIIPALFVAPLAPLAMALNRANIFLRIGLTELLFKVPLITVGAIWFGIPGIVIVRLVTSVIVALVCMAFTRNLIGLSIRQQTFAPWRAVASGGVMTLVLLLVRPGPADVATVRLALLLAETVVLAAAVYVLTLIALWRVSGCPGGVEAFALGYCRRIMQQMRPKYRKMIA